MHPAPTRPTTDFARPVHCVLGIPFDAVDMADAIARIRDAVRERRPCWLSTANVQFMIAARKDAAFRDSLLHSDLTVIDGMPLLWIARALGLPFRERVAGADLFDRLLEGAGGPIRVFFFGGPEGAAEEAFRRVNARGGSMRCVGWISPGFGSVEAMSSDGTIAQINAAEPDFVVVSLGSQKGQAWIQRNRAALHAPVISHLGAVVNFAAGTVNRAPQRLQRAGFEWLWRIKEEPQLWRRYGRDGLALAALFATRVVPASLSRFARFLRGTNPSPSFHIDDAAHPHTLHASLLGAWCGADAHTQLRAMLQTLTATPRDLVLDLGGTPRMDAAAVALLLLLQGFQQAAGRSLRLIAPSPTLRRCLWRHGADHLLHSDGASN